MTDFELFRSRNKLPKKFLANYLGVSSAFITQLVQGLRGLPEDKLKLIKANTKGWDTSMFGEGDMLRAAGGNYAIGNSGMVTQVSDGSAIKGDLTNHTTNDYSGENETSAANMSKMLDHLAEYRRLLSASQGELTDDLRSRISGGLPLPSVDGRLVADDAESYAEAVAKYGGQLVPEYNAEFRGGDHGATLHSSDLVGHWIIPNAPKGSFIVTMVGRSMEPQIASGSKLLLAPMHFDPRMPLSIPFGQLFGVVVRDGDEVGADNTFSAHIKILRRHREKNLERSVWVASSVNSEQFDDFEIPITRVTHLYKVLTSINALWGY